jgi:hypothetical protein
MDDLRGFFDDLILELEGRVKADPNFVVDFNKLSSRTRLMLGTKAGRGGLMKAAIIAFLKRKGKVAEEWSYHRYMYIIASEGDWWLGEKIALVIAEVENRIKEFRGTVSDLVRFQAHQKIAVFYEANLTAEKLQSYETQVREVLGYQFGKGFFEAEDTEYLIVFGPTNITEGIGRWWATWFMRHGQQSARHQNRSLPLSTPL